MTILSPDIRLPKPDVAGSSPVARFLPGPHTEVRVCHTTAASYHGWPEVTCSQLKALRESPLAFYWRHVAKAAPPRSSDALDYGSLLHTWAEVGEAEFWPRVEVCPDNLATAAGAFSAKAKEWKANLDPTRIPVAPADFKKLRDQTAALLRNPDVTAIIARAVDAEFNVRWKWNGHDCRCRVDGATPDFFFDWKTTRDENPAHEWWRSALKFGYHLQSAMYESAGLAIGMPAHRMVFIVTSTVWPYESVVGPLPQRVIDHGRSECLRLLDELQMRLDLDCWDRIDARGAKEIYFPAYALKGM